MNKMKRIFSLTALSAILFSCGEKNSNTTGGDIFVKVKKATAQNTIEGTLKESLAYDLQFSEQVQIHDRAVFQAKHKDEILKTIEVVQKDSIPGKDIVLVYYRYSVGADIVRSTSYMKQIDGKWYVHSKYYSSYEDDPFGNGKGEEGKKILKKAEDWEKESNEIWWK
jgi:hypothetical protein